MAKRMINCDRPSDWFSRFTQLLRSIDGKDRREELRLVFEERAGICEYDGCMDRGDAERTAWEEVERRQCGMRQYCCPNCDSAMEVGERCPECEHGEDFSCDCDFCDGLEQEDDKNDQTN